MPPDLQFLCCPAYPTLQPFADVPGGASFCNLTGGIPVEARTRVRRHNVLLDTMARDDEPAVATLAIVTDIMRWCETQDLPFDMIVEQARVQHKSEQ